MYYDISSMQNTSKLLQCTHKHRNEVFIFKSQSLHIPPKSSSPAFYPAVRLCAFQHHSQRHQDSPLCTVIVWLSEALMVKGVNRQSISRKMPEQAVLQQTWTVWECCFQDPEPEHRQITMTEFNIFLEAFIISTAA